MFDQTRIVMELLRQMIVGEHPVDLKLTRFCAAKLHYHTAVDKIEMLDQAQLFQAPARFVGDLRRDAMQALEGIATQQHD